MMDRFKKLLVTGLGTGHLPVAPGTWGSVAVGAIFLAVAWGSDGRWQCVSGTMLAVGTLAGAACIALGGFAEAAYGKKDPRPCTIDEWAGQAVTYLLLPLGGGSTHWLITAGAGFLAFRAFDIAKPPPARRVEKLPLGWGILLDDVVAGIYANIACQLVLRFWLYKLI